MKEVSRRAIVRAAQWALSRDYSNHSKSSIYQLKKLHQRVKVYSKSTRSSIPYLYSTNHPSKKTIHTRCSYPLRTIVIEVMENKILVSLRDVTGVKIELESV